MSMSGLCEAVVSLVCMCVCVCVCVYTPFPHLLLRAFLRFAFCVGADNAKKRVSGGRILGIRIAVRIPVEEGVDLVSVMEPGVENRCRCQPLLSSLK